MAVNNNYIFVNLAPEIYKGAIKDGLCVTMYHDPTFLLCKIKKILRPLNP